MIAAGGDVGGQLKSVHRRLDYRTMTRRYWLAGISLRAAAQEARQEIPPLRGLSRTNLLLSLLHILRCPRTYALTSRYLPVCL